MKHTLINTGSYLLVVSDEEIKNGDWMYQGVINYVRKYLGAADNIDVKRPAFKDHKKIIAHLPLNNYPILQGVDLLPPLEQENDVEKLADDIYPETYYSGIYVDRWLKAGFIDGYNKAKEKYKYTEEDMRKAYLEGKSYVADTIPYFDNFEEFIQSLSQPKTPVGFEHTTTIRPYESDITKDVQATWVGRYIYE